ncbi:MAG TPA: peptidyl-prolyl cis-trans isomerase [Solirubrobacterales bacterium]|nr:peptidyl-prolyl cis-trans isomerase [Solirubrobacterales bacterium]
MQRLAVVVFGAVFVVLFLVIGISEGVGEPSVPEGDVAIVKGVPDGNVSEADLKHAVLQQVAAGGLKKTPARGTKKFEELQEKALEELLNAIWVRGEGEELGIEITPKQIATELATIKKQNFKTEAAFQKFLKTSHYTKKDVNERVRLQILGTQIQERIAKQAPPPSEAEISNYYDSVKATQYTTKPTRDIRVVITEKKGDATKAKAILAKDNSDGSWKKVAAKYSTDPTSKSKGGLLESISEETLQEPLKAAVFKSVQGEVVGPVKYQKNFIVLQVDKLNPEKVQSLDEVKAQIKTQLTQTKAQNVVAEFLSDYQSKWQSRTFCADGFVINRCSNYKGSGHPSTASPACYEANPKTPAKECPAPVAQAKPALPGTVTVIKPQGEQLAQMPRPAGLAEESEAAALPETTPGAAEAPTGE